MVEPGAEDQDPLLEAAAEAAEGRASEDLECAAPADRKVLANLARLASLKDAFSRLDGELAGLASGAPSQAPGHWGHLAIIAELGRGGFGVVYRAFDPVLQREVALKLRREDVAGTDASAWIAEARRLARVRHRHVLAVHGADVDGGRAGLWSDLIEGVPLDAELDRVGAMSRRGLIALGSKLASALSAIHRAGLAHGDVKAENVMIEGGEPTLMDFGAGGEIGSQPRYGTRASMAPELLDRGRASAASDVYAFGLLLLRCALGRLPAASQGFQASLRQAGRRAGRPMLRLFQRMLAEDPAARPSAEAVEREFERIAELPRRRARLAALAVVLVSLGAGLAASLLALERTRAERDRSERIRNFLVEGLMGVSPLRADRPASALEVVEFLEEGLDRRLAELPQARAEMRLLVGEAFTHLGQGERGFANLKQAIDELASAPRRDPAQQRALAHGLVSLAVAYRKQADVERALATADRAEREFEHLDRSRSNELGKIQLAALRGNIFNGMGRPLSALAAHRETARLRAALIGADDPGMAVDHNNIAAAAHRAGLYAEAEQAYRNAARLLAAGERSESVPMMFVQLGLAMVLMHQPGRVDEARAHLDEAARLAAANLPEDHPNRWRVRMTAEQLRLAGGDPASALGGLLALAESQPEIDDLKSALAFHTGLAALEAGQPALARDALAHAASIASEDLPRVLASRAGSLFAAWRAGDAVPDIEAALAEDLARLERSDFAARRELELLRAWQQELSGPAVGGQSGIDGAGRSQSSGPS